MKFSIFGLGYVGCVTAGCLSRDGHQVIGVDIIESKVELLATGTPTVVEPGLQELICDGQLSGRITATTDAKAAVLATDVSLICVGTPNTPDGNLDLRGIRETALTIGNALREKSQRHLVILRSTVPPGTCQLVILPALLEGSGLTEHDVGLVIVPEFLREGRAIKDYYDPPFVVAGNNTGEPGPDATIVAGMFQGIVQTVQWVHFREAEMVKSLCNVFHALKVAFANEVGALCESLSLDGHAIMQHLVQDRKLNISPAYLRPGLPFGGSCLPKDLRMVLSLGRESLLDLPLLRGVLESNQAHISRAVAAVTAVGRRRIGLDGLSFKAGTDDLRESPMVLIAEHLIGKGYDLRIYDPDVHVARLIQANRKYMEAHIPHLESRLVSSPDDLLEHSELIVLTRDRSAVRDLVDASVKPFEVVDLTGLSRTDFGQRSTAEQVAPFAGASDSKAKVTEKLPVGAAS